MPLIQDGQVIKGALLELGQNPCCSPRYTGRRLTTLALSAVDWGAAAARMLVYSSGSGSGLELPELPTMLRDTYADIRRVG